MRIHRCLVVLGAEAAGERMPPPVERPVGAKAVGEPALQAAAQVLRLGLCVDAVALQAEARSVVYRSLIRPERIISCAQAADACISCRSDSISDGVSAWITLEPQDVLRLRLRESGKVVAESISPPTFD